MERSAGPKPAQDEETDEPAGEKPEKISDLIGLLESVARGEGYFDKIKYGPHKEDYYRWRYYEAIIPAPPKGRKKRRRAYYVGNDRTRKV